MYDGKIIGLKRHFFIIHFSEVLFKICPIPHGKGGAEKWQKSVTYYLNGPHLPRVKFFPKQVSHSTLVVSYLFNRSKKVENLILNSKLFLYLRTSSSFIKNIYVNNFCVMKDFNNSFLSFVFTIPSQPPSLQRLSIVDFNSEFKVQTYSDSWQFGRIC
jgi:hypothetical protein